MLIIDVSAAVACMGGRGRMARRMLILGGYGVKVLSRLAARFSGLKVTEPFSCAQQNRR
jgi:hypothetical protein